MYNPLTDEEIKNNIRSMFSDIEDKNMVELAIKCLMNKKYSRIGSIDKRELDIVREKLGINNTRTPKTLKEIGEMQELSGGRVEQLEKITLKTLHNRVKNFKEKFRLNEIKLSDNTIEFMFMHPSFINFEDYFLYLADYVTEETPELFEIKQAFKKFYEQHSSQFNIGNLNIPIEKCNFSDRLCTVLKRNGIETINDLLEKTKMGLINFEGRHISSKEQEEIINFINSLKKDNIEEVQIESEIEKQQGENSIIRERIEKKEELLKKYKKVSDEKAQLLDKEKQLDDELKIIMEKIKGSYMENKNDRTKK